MMKLANIAASRDFIEKRLEDSGQIVLIALNRDLTIIDHNKGLTKLIEQNTNLNGKHLKNLLLPESWQLFCETLPMSSRVRLNFALHDNNSVALLSWIHQTDTGYLMYGEQGMPADSDIMRTMTVLYNDMAGLTRELQRNNRILDQTQKKLRLRNEEIEQFATIVAHDFNSPLITISSFVAQLEEDMAAGNHSEVAADLGYIKGATKKLGELLGGLQQITSIDKAPKPAQQVDLGQLIQDCLTTLAGPLRQKNIRVIVEDTPLQLAIDPLQLGQIWQNLIENALKYMGDQPQPQINIGMDQHGEEPIFYVRDNGIGIAPQHAERVFRLFTQLSKSNPGSGLGLALVKKIIASYHGKIWVESEGKGKGSCFKFTLTGALVNNG